MRRNRTHPAPLVIGVTGAIGSGKSALSGAIKSLGAVVFDADARGKEITASPEVLAVLVRRLGPTVRTASGKLNRTAMAKCVFGDTTGKSLAILNGVVRPQLTRQIREAIANHRKGRGARPLIIDAALLIHWPSVMRRLDHLIVVSAPIALRKSRLISRGLPAAEIERRMRTQETDRQYRSFATVVFRNTGSRAALRIWAKEFWLQATGEK